MAPKVTQNNILGTKNVLFAICQLVFTVIYIYTS